MISLVITVATSVLIKITIAAIFLGVVLFLKAKNSHYKRITIILVIVAIAILTLLRLGNEETKAKPQLPEPPAKIALR